ncbi:1-aminocyclopropane-1-carboxylate synthase-like protein [Paramyrothecium foliicola]|nr:1-aminocyclopropane-1-carboxylate synthase-like protein [Paramyrothecium foliicola]
MLIRNLEPNSNMSGDILSSRGAAAEATLDIPWRFAPPTTYDPVTNKSGLISLATAENKLVVDYVTKFINEANIQTKPDDILYSAGSVCAERFSRALAVHMNEYFNPHQPIASKDILLTSAATAMHDILAWALANPGEGILTSRPVYGRFELDFGNKSQVKVVYADTDAGNCFEEDVVDKFEAALERSEATGTKIRALLIVNPHNPLGKCYPRSTLVNIMKFCQRHRIHLFSDEIYACSVFGSGERGALPFTSVLSIDSTDLIDQNLLHVTYGLSKDFAAPGLRVGAIITRSQAILRTVQTILRFHGVSGVSLAIGAAMLEDKAWRDSYIAYMRGSLAKAYQHVSKGLRQLGVRYLPGANAGFFINIDLSPYLPQDLEGEANPEFALARKLKNAGVFLHPREEHSLEPGWFRVVYSRDEATITEGLRRCVYGVVQEFEN